MPRVFLKWIGPNLKTGLAYEVLEYDRAANLMRVRHCNGVELTTRFRGTDLANKDHYQLVTIEE